MATYYSGKPHPPTDVAASRGTYPDTIRVSWTASAGATSYEIWRGATANRNVSAKIGEISDISYMDTFDLAVGQTYYYWINGKNPAGAARSAPQLPDMSHMCLPQLQASRLQMAHTSTRLKWPGRKQLAPHHMNSTGVLLQSLLQCDASALRIIYTGDQCMLL